MESYRKRKWRKNRGVNGEFEDENNNSRNGQPQSVYCETIEDTHKTIPEDEQRTSTWIFDNIGETTTANIKEKLIAEKVMITNTQSLEKGGFSVTMKGIKVIMTMCDLKDWFAKKKYRIHIPKNLL